MRHPNGIFTCSYNDDISNCRSPQLPGSQQQAVTEFTSILAGGQLCYFYYCYHTNRDVRPIILFAWAPAVLILGGRGGKLKKNLTLTTSVSVNIFGYSHHIMYLFFLLLKYYQQMTTDQYQITNHTNTCNCVSLTVLLKSTYFDRTQIIFFISLVTI